MKSFREYRRDAIRYRALKSTDQASPWTDVLGGHKNLDGLADALVKVIQGDGDSLGEDAPGMSIGGGAGVAGLVGDPPVSKMAQRRWTRKNGIVRRRRET